jgi:hypothetical protein
MTIKIPIYTDITPFHQREKKDIQWSRNPKASYATETSKSQGFFRSFAPRIKDTTRADSIASGIPSFS